MSRTLGLRTGLHKGRTPDRIVAIVEVNAPGRLTIDHVMLELEERFGSAPTRDTVRKAIDRLAKDGMIVTETERFDDYDSEQRWGRRAYGERAGYLTYTRILVGAA